MSRRRGNGALWALMLAGGAWAWQNRDKIRDWAESNPQVRDTVDQVAQSNPQIRDALEKHIGWQTQQPDSASSQQYHAGSSYNSGMNTGANYPVTGETRRISPDDTVQDSRGSGI